jgi:hypothetical protein
MQDVSELPGHDLFLQGVADLDAGRRSQASLLVSLARTRLTEAGLDVPPSFGGRAAHELYDLLAAEGPDSAHGRYNALLRRMASFARAAEHAAAR